MTPRHLRRRTAASARGTTLLEAMIALTVLLVGLLGMARLQIYGVNSTQGARAQTIAAEYANELAGALSRLPASDARLSASPGGTTTSPPPLYGRLLPLGITPDGAAPAGVHEWSDTFATSTPAISGVRLDAAIERDPEHAAAGIPLYRRRWTVWDAGVAANGTAAKLIAVSVIWRERGSAARREVVLYVNSEVKGSFMANINAFN